LFGSKEAIEQFEICSFQELLRSLPNFTPISIIPHTGKPQNLDINRHWHSLRLFKLFFSWKTMSIIVNSTNSYAFRTNSAKNPWKTLEIQELYYFFGCLIKLGL
jgi:Transposase IS4